jgi:hypothetical protein
MALLFDSGAMDFAADEADVVEVAHNIGKCP